MKTLLLYLSFSAFCTFVLYGQTDEASSTTEPPPPAGATVITSDELQMDQASHTSIFTGNVVVVGTNFRMTCDEMTVYSTTANKIDHIIAQEHVIIIQPGRITHCGHAVYTRSADMFDLTDQPDILDNKDHLEAPEIFIWRTDKRLKTKGPTRTTIIGGMSSSSSTNSVETPAAPK